MSIIQGNTKSSESTFYPKVINGSLRFNDDDSAYLSWTPASAGNRKTWTWSGWVKRGNLGSSDIFTATDGSSSNRFALFFNGDILDVYHRLNAVTYRLQTNAVFRDPSAWYHIVFIYDADNGTQADRQVLYVNGERITDFATETNPSSTGVSSIVNTANEHRTGVASWNPNYLDGYLANVHFIDGQALTASDFGETKNGVWVAKDYAGTFGTNGFYLTFEDDTQVEAFNTVLYRGNGGTQSITGVGFQPDLVWVKSRNNPASHNLFDAVRGTNKTLFSNLTNAETTDTDKLLSFDSDGFKLGSDSTGTGSCNVSGYTHVAWCWKAGDSNVSNTDGTITSTVRANDTYGFSIVSYTGTGSAGATVGHGLSSAPEMIIVKNRDAADNWCVYHSSLGATQTLRLNDTLAAFTRTGSWNNTAPTVDDFTIGTDSEVNTNTQDYIAYCWSETTGVSKFGSYTGTGSAGNAVTTGFKPAWLMIKRTDTANDWIIVDATRNTSNPIDKGLYADLSNAENTTSRYNFTDTGFSFTSGLGESNASGGTYIYAAFADTREAAFWLDQSGNDNDWQPVNLDHNDTVADSPTNNFATLNPLFDEASGHTFADGNLKVTTKTTGYGVSVATIVPTAGKFYAEITVNTVASTVIGIRDVTIFGGNNAFVTQNDSKGLAYYFGGTLYGTNVSTDSTGGASYTSGDVIGIAINYDDGEVRWYKNGTIQYTKTGLDLTNMALAVGDVSNVSASTMTANFGQQPFKYNPPE